MFLVLQAVRRSPGSQTTEPDSDPKCFGDSDAFHLASGIRTGFCIVVLRCLMSRA